ncbi:MAG: hypothetical protein K2X38_08565 [Gemmataceae bacterium]|nr:hypothetical protein [Gemmataceae bacterium]
MARRLAALWLLGCTVALPGCGTAMGLRPLFGEAPPHQANGCNSCGGAIFMPDSATPIAKSLDKKHAIEPPENPMATAALGKPKASGEREANRVNSESATPKVGLVEFEPEPKKAELQLVTGPIDPVQRKDGSSNQGVNTLPEAPPFLEKKKEGEHTTKFASQFQPMVEALQCVLAERPEEALRHLQSYDPETQDLLLRLLPTVGVFARKKVSDLSSDEADKVSEQFVAMQAIVRPRTELVITKARFCEWARAFGIYKPLPADHGFLASTPQRPGEKVQLYVELKNFFSDPKQGGIYETSLASTVEIRDAKGQSLWSHRFEDEKKPLRSLTPIHDYFNNYSFTLPPLPPGFYTLTIAVADQTRADQRRIATKSIDFRVTALPPRGL